MTLQPFSKDTLIDGKPATQQCIEIDGQTFTVTGGLLRTVALEDEWFEDIKDVETVINTLTNSGFNSDLLTFWQRLPNIELKYPYHVEWESIAALKIKDFDYWWNKQAKGTTRNMVRKSQKAGVETREAKYDDAFVRGMAEVFNETPVRQGRRFWHYGKDFETIKQQFSRYLFREDLIGAYCGNEMAGFVMLGNAGNYGLLGQFISKLKLRDKAINNALIAHAVKLCANKGLPYLVYGYWGQSSLSDFKRHCGFEEVKLPRHFVPLSARGKVALKSGLHRGWKAALPNEIREPLKRIRKAWLERSTTKHER